MGTQSVGDSVDASALRRFTGRLLADLDRLERLLEDGAIEKGPTRIGAELELFLVDDHLQPSDTGPAILSSIADPRVTAELGAFNLEVNTEPIPLGGGCLGALESRILELLATVRVAAEEAGSKVVLVGILPTLEPRHATLAHMSPSDRYVRLNEAMTALRGGPHRVFIKGVDELNLVHDSVMLEACNTSFQIHLQVDPDRFARVYNLGLLALAPLLAGATNSPVLFGRRLWRETRIALFQQSVDTRRPGPEHRVFTPRVDFGTAWVDESVLEIYREDVARFRAVLTADPEPECEGDVPRLAALQLFNSTVYRWLRPCYGVANGRAHLRIENRALPAGPTPRDQVANAAFWYGLLFGLEETVEDPRARIEFDDVRGNFFSAARFGLEAPLTWLDGRQEHARDLILDGLLEVAARGLERAGVDEGEASLYLNVIAERTASRRTGSEWLLRALGRLRGYDATPWARLTHGILERQRDNRPVHEWDDPEVPRRSITERLQRPLGAHMRRDLVTVRATDPVALAIRLMRWRRIRHLPVEDDDQRLVGLVTRSTLFRFLSRTEHPSPDDVAISEIMQDELVTAPAALPVADAIRLMRERGVSSLPIVEGGRLVGLVTERDFLTLAAEGLLGPEVTGKD